MQRNRRRLLQGLLAAPVALAWAGPAADALDALGYGANGQGAVDVIGYHTGTFIAAELAVIRPDLVRRLVLPGIPYNAGEKRKEMYEQYARRKELTEDGSNAMEVWRFWVNGRHPGVSLQRGALERASSSRRWRTNTRNSCSWRTTTADRPI